MKKMYEKPQVIFENFSLSTNIAADCDNRANHSYKQYGCGYYWERQQTTVFTTEYGCITTEDDGDFNGICYHVPEESYNLFNS